MVSVLVVVIHLDFNSIKVQLEQGRGVACAGSLVISIP